MGIKIGPIAIDDPVILAPMSSVTDMPFRRLVKRCGAGLVVSEMIASQAMIRETRDSLKRAANALDEKPVSMQLAGCDPAEMAEQASAFASLGSGRMIATKLDLVRQRGGVGAAAGSADLAFAEFGQSPEIGAGLAPVNPVSLARLLLGATSSVSASPETAS